MFSFLVKNVGFHIFPLKKYNKRFLIKKRQSGQTQHLLLKKKNNRRFFYFKKNK